MVHISTDTHLYLCNKAPVLTLSLFALCFASVRMCLPGVWEVWYNLLDYTALKQISQRFTAVGA